MDVIAAIHTRRSVRSYLTRHVPRKLIEEIVWDAAQAPPPFSGQLPWTFNIIEGVERISAYGARTEGFVAELMNAISRQLDKGA